MLPQRREGFVYQNSLDKRKKLEPENFLKRYLTNWSYKLYRTKEIANDTITSYKFEQFPERFNEAVLKETQLKLKENDSVMTSLRSNQIASVHHYSH